MSQLTGDGLRPDDGLDSPNSLAELDDLTPDDFRDDIPRRRGLSSAKWRIIACLAIVVAALGWVAVSGLSGNLVYYLTPTDISNHKADVGQRIRLGGYVVPGSVGRAGQLLKFTVSDGTKSMTVVDTGSVPELFKAGQGVVVEGSLGSDGRFHSDTLLIKHNGDYQPPSPGEKPPNSANLSQGG
ncbi:MAG TPA: cytochrome c maturation protein CcmE [Pseudonocardiaceae bacterium]|nr:cytochrome c maturation protein CcmE [Pseudonocardiaceae bacterium]